MSNIEKRPFYKLSPPPPQKKQQKTKQSKPKNKKTEQELKNDWKASSKLLMSLAASKRGRIKFMIVVEKKSGKEIKLGTKI